MGNFDRGNRGGGGSRGGFGRSSGGSRGGGRGFGGGGRDFGGSRDYGNNRGGGDREMFPAVCDNCGKDCEVPFRPTGSKPVLCSNCFGKQKDSEPRRFNDRGSRSSEGGARPQNNEQLNVINAKLDQILALINGAPKGKPAKAVKTPKAEKVEKTEKVETPKLDVSEMLEAPEPANDINVVPPLVETPSSKEE